MLVESTKGLPKYSGRKRVFGSNAGSARVSAITVGFVFCVRTGLWVARMGLLDVCAGLLSVRMGLLDVRAGLLVARMDLLEARTGLLDVRMDLLDARTGLLRALLALLETGVVLLRVLLAVLAEVLATAWLFSRCRAGFVDDFLFIAVVGLQVYGVWKGIGGIGRHHYMFALKAQCIHSLGQSEATPQVSATQRNQG